MPQASDFTTLFDDDINLRGLFDILSPENNLVLADDMMLSDAKGIILRVSESYEKNFGFVHNSIVGRSAFDLEADGTFSPCVTAEVIRRRRKITATQTINHSHKNVMTVGIPLFDRSGELKFAVCFNTVSMEQINAIQRNYRHLQDSSSTPRRSPSSAPGTPPPASSSKAPPCSASGPLCRTRPTQKPTSSSPGRPALGKVPWPRPSTP